MEKDKKQGSIYGLLAVLVVVGCFLAAWKILLPNYRSHNQEYAQLKEDINAAKNKISALQSTKQQLDNIKGTVDKILVAMPGDRDTPNLVAELEAIAAQNQAYIPSIQLSSTETAATTSQIDATSSSSINTIAFSASGSFENLSGLLKSLESDLRFFDIKTLGYSYSDEDRSMALSLQINLPVRQSL